MRTQWRREFDEVIRDDPPWNHPRPPLPLSSGGWTLEYTEEGQSDEILAGADTLLN